MRVDLIHSVEYIFHVTKDDYGNDMWLVFLTTINKGGYHPFCGYMVMSKNIEKWSNCYAHEESAYWNNQDKELLKIEKDNFVVEEYKYGSHSLCNTQTGLTTKFYIRKIKME